MADYWKSQAKKFCDFCKCWIADNKPSVEFHEKGKRHKENVEKRLKEISQKSRKEYKETLKVDSEMKKMEEAAMKAYLKDIAGDGEGDYTSQQIKQELKEKQEAERKRREALAEESKVKERLAPAEAVDSKIKVEDVEEKVKVPWLEALSDGGDTYYWHIETGAAVWEVPSEGFVSLVEQKNREDVAKKDAEAAKVKQEKAEASRKEEETRAKEAEESARKAREKMRARAVKKEKKEITPFEPVVMGPATKPDPYGGWKAVDRFDQTPVDLQLPKQDYVEVSVPVIVEREKKFKFREKTVGSLDNEGSANFKKRKLNAGSKQNMRQRQKPDDLE